MVKARATSPQAGPDRGLRACPASGLCQALPEHTGGLDQLRSCSYVFLATGVVPHRCSGNRRTASAGRGFVAASSPDLRGERARPNHSGPMPTTARYEVGWSTTGDLGACAPWSPTRAKERASALQLKWARRLEAGQAAQMSMRSNVPGASARAARACAIGATCRVGTGAVCQVGTSFHCAR